MSFLGVAGALSSLPARGWVAVIEFAWAAAAALVGAASAWALWTRAPAAIPLARTAIAAALIRELQRLVWTALPSDVIPGTRWAVATVVVTIAAALFVVSGARFGPRLSDGGNGTGDRR